MSKLAVVRFLCLFLAAGICAPSALGAEKPSRARPAAPVDLASEFAALAQQKPWTCAEQVALAVPGTGWQGGVAECAWQNRLRMRRWSGQGGLTSGQCVSAQAHWWAWARSLAPAAVGVPAAWRSAWQGQVLADDSGPEKMVVLIRALPGGAWSATEWRWNPSPRAATRRWQQGRWELLLARARQFGQAPEAAAGPLEARMLRTTLETNLGARAGEISSQDWQWHSEGLCLSVDALGLGQQLMQLPYSLDDSRAEQRAAMQLQLARRYPKAIWMTPFSVVPAAPNARGGAKFFAVWLDGAILKGQLWIPTKAGGPLVRLRITTALQPADGQSVPPKLARAEKTIQRELMGLATRWAQEHE